jgi:putative lipoprotein
MKLFSLALLCLPLLVQAEGERLPYTCDNGSRIDISFSTSSDGRPQATLHFADSQLVLPQVPSASGNAFKQDEIALYTKDEQAIFEDGKGNIRRCQLGQEMPTSSAPAASSSFIDITGEITYPPGSQLPTNAQLILRVQDKARRGKSFLTLAEQRIDLRGQIMPIAFQITIDRDLLRKNAQPFVTAVVESKGKRLFIEDKHYAALHDQQPRPLSIMLKASGKVHR